MESGPDAERIERMHNPRGFWDEHGETSNWDAAYTEAGPLVVDGQRGVLAQPVRKGGAEFFIPAPGAPWSVAGRMTINRSGE